MEIGVASTKLLGIKYNMDDMKKTMEDDQATLDLAKEALEKLRQQNMDTAEAICNPNSLTDLSNLLIFILGQKLLIVGLERSSCTEMFLTLDYVMVYTNITKVHGLFLCWGR
jgi:hypothetical protein